MVSTSDRKQVVLADGDDRADEGRGDAGQRQRADDDADDGAGDADRQRVAWRPRPASRRQSGSVSRPPRNSGAGGDEQRDRRRATDVDAVAQEARGGEAERDPEDDAQNAERPISAASGMPRISTMVSASPMVPAKIGV